MKFRRINKNTINCIITSEEMQAHGVGIDDIFEKKEQGMDFLRQILNEAARRLDFHASGTVTSMQLSVLPDKSLSLTISEQNDKSVEDMVRNLRKKLGIVINEKMRKELAKLPQEERLKRLADYAARFIEKELTDSVVDGIGAVVDENGTSSNGISRTTADGNNGTMADGNNGTMANGNNVTTANGNNGTTGSDENGATDNDENALTDGNTSNGNAGIKNASEESSNNVLQDSSYLFEFTSFAAVLDAAKYISKQPVYCKTKFAAELYTDGADRNPLYWLILTKPEGKDQQFAKLILSLNEYGTMETARAEVLAHIRELSTCILKEKTIKTLAAI